LALPHITFGLNTHISTTTKLSPFEFAHGFPARVPLTFGQSVHTMRELGAGQYTPPFKHASRCRDLQQ